MLLLLRNGKPEVVPLQTKGRFTALRTFGSR
jgi:hypothetical protein